MRNPDTEVTRGNAGDPPDVTIQFPPDLSGIRRPSRPRDDEELEPTIVLGRE